MATYVALLRGVNVGGTTMLPMADFRAALAGLGARDVASYIQSGNAVFRHEGWSDELTAALSGALVMAGGGHPAALVLEAEAITQALAANPFPEAEPLPKSLHIFFLQGPVSPDLDALRARAVPGEEVALRGSLFYLYAPEGVGRSKLAAAVPRAFKGTTITARNLATCRKLAEMAGALGAG